jgi:hypothetical protein
MEIVEKKEDVKDKFTKQMVKAAAGDEEPTSDPAFKFARIKKRKLTWLLAHFGGPSVCCTLICPVDLRIKTGMINKTMFHYLGDYGDACEQKAAVEALLTSKGVWIRDGAVKAKSKDVNAAYKRYQLRRA